MVAELPVSCWFPQISALGSMVKTGCWWFAFFTISPYFSLWKYLQIVFCYPQIFHTSNSGPE